MTQTRQASTDLGEFGLARLKQQADGALVLITSEAETFGRVLKSRAVAALLPQTGFVQTKRSRTVCAWVSEALPLSAAREDRDRRATAIKEFLDLIMDRELNATAASAIARRKDSIAATPIRTGRLRDVVVSQAQGGYHLTPDNPEKSHGTIKALLRNQGKWLEAEKRWFIPDAQRKILKKAMESYAAREEKSEPSHEVRPAGVLTKDPVTGEIVLRLEGSTADAGWAELRARPGGAAIAVRSGGAGKTLTELPVQRLASFLALVKSQGPA